MIFSILAVLTILFILGVVTSIAVVFMVPSQAEIDRQKRYYGWRDGK